MADAIVLPLNTTHYAYELENYLNKYASSYFSPRAIHMHTY